MLGYLFIHVYVGIYVYRLHMRNMYIQLHMYDICMVLYNCNCIMLLYKFIKDNFKQFGNTPPCNL